ncbi:hypothetical protein PoMZ_04737 [Pyricularia oryzae]|uniref:Uncharacterized protein n=1 Tax=Pyricularia oryzae TaxID=318829 RepID=A0A4P7NAZ3_PYROR|nr:hypothetical protein PoMZ_04737 [Pyricularia oryzae]
MMSPLGWSSRPSCSAKGPLVLVLGWCVRKPSVMEPLELSSELCVGVGVQCDLFCQAACHAREVQGQGRAAAVRADAEDAGRGEAPVFVAMAEEAVESKLRMRAGSEARRRLAWVDVGAATLTFPFPSILHSPIYSGTDPLIPARGPVLCSARNVPARRSLGIRLG